ncbi:universal stress protein [Virgisporangium aurantiacum]|uniref:Universal stress protein n=1 Tax=Virgisporangium aurantiacum TaxID=175570 RepID=A0A8J3Z1Q9_9ACTN|nr:universal stress protein [Virgisporangium aurantiacum]GIJ54757.1 universal stress protein [Virgisporangium aurantiacum]
MMQAYVVAGIDGSPSSVAAAQYAAEWAERSGRDLHLVHGSRHGEPGDDVLRRVADCLTAQHPGLSIVCRAVPGAGSAVLVEESGAAELTVVGSRGGGSIPTAALGATATIVATHARGPVVIARPPAAMPGPDLPVLVGVDGSDHSVAALDFAFDIARRTGASVVAAHVWWTGRMASDADAQHRAETAGAVLDDALEPWRAKFPDVRLEEKLVSGANVAEDLVAESAHAGLAVVGTRGHGGFAGLLLGSVSLSVAQHAHCPVAIVR